MRQMELGTERQELILESRETAVRIVRSIMRRWGMRLTPDEIQSLSDLALCEAAKRFDPSKQVKFVTYLFHFLRGTLIAEVKGRRRTHSTIAEGLDAMITAQSKAPRLPRELEVFSSESGESEQIESSCPEINTYRAELRSACRKALNSLTPLEKEAVVGIHLDGIKVAQLARKIGYSRGHLSAIRKSAFEKLRPQLEQLAA